MSILIKEPMSCEQASEVEKLQFKYNSYKDALERNIETKTNELIELLSLAIQSIPMSLDEKKSVDELISKLRN